MRGISFLIPVRNAGPGLSDTIRSVLAQVDRRQPFEIVVVDDGSIDGAVARARREHLNAPIVLVRTDGRGAAAALNRGLEVARYPLIAQVDQDVVLHAGWLQGLTASIGPADVAAVQAQYVADPDASLLARVMARDLQERYAALGEATDHVCTGNVLYRADALRAIGGFDESLGYGYDNDVSYRLRAAGYRLLYCPTAHSTHRWREGLTGYARQQYGFGYGRLDLVAKHRRRLTGDSVSPLAMMLHPLVAAAAAALALIAYLNPSARSAQLLTVAAAMLALLVVERAVVGVRASARFNDWTPLLFPIVHLLRDASWVCAIAIWSGRRVAGSRPQPTHSMRPRPLTSPDQSARDDSRPLPARRPSGAL